MKPRQCQQHFNTQYTLTVPWLEHKLHGPLTNALSDILNFNSVTPSELSTFLGLGSDAVVDEISEGRYAHRPPAQPRVFSVAVNSLDEAMAIFGYRDKELGMFTRYHEHWLSVSLLTSHPASTSDVVTLQNSKDDASRWSFPRVASCLRSLSSCPSPFNWR